MNLSDSEEQQFIKIYNRLKSKNNNAFDQAFCLRLMTKRGNLPKNLAEKVLGKNLFLIFLRFQK